ncbi:hypothetical protein HOLleu_29486 [Holothuria leucospilota]|uniref:C2H2-type domain-containing protein n=1 Tax=Holothuria leucospilota TaxID=206669 RepID=A0A9Q1BNR7_HOLLE|nr:hypothetical protein HOLleu_29486 [Holothuria leucospilota]
MGFVCFKCGQLILGDGSCLIWHLRNFHHLVVGRVFTQPIICAQEGCARTFKNHVSTFKAHLKSKHTEVAAPQVDQVMQDSSDDEQNLFENNQPLARDIAGDEEYVENNENWDDFDKTEIEHRIAIFLAKLLSSCSVVQSTINGVVDHMSDILEDIVSFLKHSTVQFAEANMIQPEDNTFCALMEDFEKCENTFGRFKGDYLRRKYFVDSGMFLTPMEVPIGIAFYQRNNRQTGNISQVLRNVTFQYVPIKPLIKLILESNGYMESISKHEPANNGLMKDFHDGEYCRLNEFFKSKENIKVLLYIDDFEVTNPLSPKAGTHKLGAVYFTITNLHPKFRSSLDNCYLVMLFNAGDAKLYGYEPILDPLVKDLNSLIRDGIFIDTPTFQGNIQVGLAQVTGDNLGIHSLFGFAQGFTANFPCRICKMHRNDARYATAEDPDIFRTKENYQMDVNTADVATTGVRNDCPLNMVEHFHVIDNFAPDIMHDLLEGICPLELKLVMKCLIDRGYFDINLLNSRIVSFNYGSSDSSNKPCILSMSSLNHPDGAPGQNSAQMWCLIRHIPLMMGDLVPEDDEHWELLLLLAQCMDIIFSPVISVGDTIYLQELIRDHHSHFLTLFPGRHLKPKHHHLTHYPRLIRKVGPLIRFWTMRFEAKHNFSRRLSHIVCNFQNIAKTLAYRNQMLLCFHLLSQKKLGEKQVEVGPGSSTILVSVANSDFLTRRLRIGLYDEVYLANWCRVFGHVYKRNQMVVVGKTIDLEPIFGKVINIIALGADVRLVYEEWSTTGFSRHLHAYSVEPKVPSKVEVTQVEDLVDYHPLQVNQSGQQDDHGFYIATRYKF